MNAARLDHQLLRDVSRSFYLSLRILPKEMRLSCGVAYLLARLSDTIADTASASLSVRIELLDAFREVLQGKESPRALETALEKDILPEVTHSGERRLLLATEDCFAHASSLPPPLLNCVTRVMEQITTGQRNDLTAFAESSPGSLRYLTDAAQLIAYTDDVAGCVGRFWSEVGLETLAGFSNASLDELRDQGTDYGRGLQLVNILRDLPEDLEAGRCYLPYRQLQAAGWNEDLDWKQQQNVLLEVVPGWETKAEEGLRRGLKYANSLRSRRTRLATALPALLGLDTLALLRAHPQERFLRKLKISRRNLRDSLFKAIYAVVPNRAITAA